MDIKDKDHYIQLRNKYHPNKLKIVFLLESPPVSGKYFYDRTGKITEPLFSALMKLLNYRPTDKKDGLEFFMNKGCLVVDATYKQVNRLKGKERDITIIYDFDNLVNDLEKICPDKDTAILLVKANVCKLFDERLTTIGFNIINKGIVIPFPSHGQQKRFHAIATEILRRFNKSI
jgi:hypothetical protein